MSSSPSIKQLRAANDAEGLIALMWEDLTQTRDAAEALTHLPERGAATQPLMVFLGERNAFIDRRTQQIRDNPNAPFRFSVSAAREGAHADMISIEFAAIRFFSAVGSKEGLELIARSTGDSDVRDHAESAIDRLVPGGEVAQAIDPLIQKLSDEFWVTRMKAADALGDMHDPRAVDPLVARLEDDDFRVVGAAASALAVIGDARAEEPLVAAAGIYKGGAGWRSVVEALGVLGGARAEARLEELARESEERISRYAIEALKELRKRA